MEWNERGRGAMVKEKWNLSLGFLFSPETKFGVGAMARFVTVVNRFWKSRIFNCTLYKESSLLARHAQLVILLGSMYLEQINKSKRNKAGHRPWCFWYP